MQRPTQYDFEAEGPRPVYFDCGRDFPDLVDQMLNTQRKIKKLGKFVYSKMLES